MGVELIQFPGSDRLGSASPYCVKAQRLLRYKGIPFTVASLVERGVPLDGFTHLARWYARVDDLTRRR